MLGPWGNPQTEQEQRPLSADTVCDEHFDGDATICLGFLATMGSAATVGAAASVVAFWSFKKAAVELHEQKWAGWDHKKRT